MSIKHIFSCFVLLILIYAHVCLRNMFTQTNSGVYVYVCMLEAAGECDCISQQCVCVCMRKCNYKCIHFLYMLACV